MLSEDEFTKEIWNKYEKYNTIKNRDRFFSKHVYKNTEYSLIVKTICTFVLTIVTSLGMVYAGISTYKYMQVQTNTDFKNNESYDYNQDMKYQNGVYYKKIFSYEEYLKSKEIWNNLVDIDKDEFKDYFVLIIAGENYSTTGLEIYSSSIDDNKNMLTIQLIKNADDINKTVVSTKLPLEYNKDNIEINIKDKVPVISGIKSIEELPKDYSKTQAINDNCFVIENNKIISENKNQLNEFIEDSKKGKNASIRIASYFDLELNIKDIEYKDGKYIVCDDDTRGETKERYYKTYDILKENKNIFGRTVSLEDKIGNQIILCIIK